MILEFAWNPLCVVIISENSFARSTLEALQITGHQAGCVSSRNGSRELTRVIAFAGAVVVTAFLLQPLRVLEGCDCHFTKGNGFTIQIGSSDFTVPVTSPRLLIFTSFN